MFLSYLNICLKLISFKVVDTVHVHLFVYRKREGVDFIYRVFSPLILHRVGYDSQCIFTGNKYMLIRRNFTFVFYTSISTQNVVIIQLYRLTYQPNFADFTIKYFTNKLTAKTAQINLVQQYLQFSPL